MRSQPDFTCGKCDHFHPQSSKAVAMAGGLATAKPSGTCRRMPPMPPMPVSILSPNGPMVVNVQPGPAADEAACGEYRPVLMS